MIAVRVLSQSNLVSLSVVAFALWASIPVAMACNELKSIAEQEDSIRSMALKGTITPASREDLLHKNQEARVAVVMTCIAPSLKDQSQISGDITLTDLKLVRTHLAEETQAHLREYDQEIVKARKSRLREFAQQLTGWKRDYQTQSEQTLAQYDRLITERQTPTN